MLPVLLFGFATPVVAQETDIDALLDAMKLDEKLTLLHGAEDPTGKAGAGYVPGVERLGIPPLRLADGPAGIRTGLPATALPAPVMLAATFDPELARRFGEVMGQEGRARDHDVLLAPMVNIVRVPQAGRNFETFGEDPLLAGRIVAAQIQGIEGEGMLATVKHYVANSFEQGRMRIDAVVDERALHEIYLPAFEAAAEAGVGAVMCAYNKVNGTHACENRELLTRILRDQFGFEGWVMTDWFARHSLAALEAGLDQEMPGVNRGPMQGVLFGDSLRVAVEAGRVPEPAVDQAVRRILTQMDRMGLLGEAPPRPVIDVEAGAATARDVALAGAVLLRNEGGSLPLTPDDLASLIVIGPTARTLLFGGGGSSQVPPLHKESPLAALQRRAGPAADIRYVAGIDLDGVAVPALALRPTGEAMANGLRRVAPDGATQIDPVVDFTGSDALPPDTEWRWTGTLTAPVTGDYGLKLQTGGGGGTLLIDGVRLLATGGFFSDASLIPTAEGLSNATAMLRLEAGKAHRIELEVQGGGGGFIPAPAGQPLQVRLAWTTPERRQAYFEEAVAAAGAARAVVVFAYNEGTEGRDRLSLALPEPQDALVAAVAKANPRTTVVLKTGDPVLMPWLHETGAVLQMWYPGQEGADATAALLLGEAVPGGKLPVTFPPADERTPIARSDERYPGVNGQADYAEGVLVGYRWYDVRDVEPLFPFGHGLSYTTFAYSALRIAPVDGGFDVTFVVRNNGDVAGSEVAQLYLGPPPDPPVIMAPRQLVGFERVRLSPGEEREVTIHFGERELSYWSIAEHDWVVVAGRRPVHVGSSSRDIRLKGEVTVAEGGN
jgi:beta-glucosidase